MIPDLPGDYRPWAQPFKDLLAVDPELMADLRAGAETALEPVLPFLSGLQVVESAFLPPWVRAVMHGAGGSIAIVINDSHPAYRERLAERFRAKGWRCKVAPRANSSPR